MKIGSNYERYPIYQAALKELRNGKYFNEKWDDPDIRLTKLSNTLNCIQECLLWGYGSDVNAFSLNMKNSTYYVSLDSNFCRSLDDDELKLHFKLAMIYSCTRREHFQGTAVNTAILWAFVCLSFVKAGVLLKDADIESEINYVGMFSCLAIITMACACITYMRKSVDKYAEPSSIYITKEYAQFSGEVIDSLISKGQRFIDKQNGYERGF